MHHDDGYNSDFSGEFGQSLNDQEFSLSLFDGCLIPEPDLNSQMDFLLDGFPTRMGLEQVPYTLEENVSWRIKEKEKVCKTGKNNCVYVLGSKGILDLTFDFTGLETEGGSFRLCAFLARSREEYKGYPIKKECKLHPGEFTLQVHSPDTHQILCPVSGKTYVYRDIPRMDTSGCVNDVTLSLSFSCFSSCVNSDDKRLLTKTMTKENARDTYLAFRLEEWTSDKIIQRSSEVKIPVCVVAQIKPSDLSKPLRRETKGPTKQMSRAIERAAEASGPRLSHSIIKQWLRTVWAAMTEEERREYLPAGCDGATPRFID